ncbi:MAG TPA: CmcJ/NvfI family oxidoreductase [Acidimicrobiales bacterium]|nr:CmcJ/NvfI family oxidoreductase [Acidimicrobiales bacterium]
MKTFCRAVLNYLPDTVGAGLAGTEVDVYDGRAAELPGWRDCGFELVSHDSSVPDWSDEEAISALHYPEVEELARQMTDAEVALVSSHIKRSPEDARRHQQLSPITLVHSDFAAGHDSIIRCSYRDGTYDGSALARNGISPDDVEKARRILILQFWRNLGPTKMDFPLAWCDARTVEVSDGRAFHVTNYAGSGFNFDALGVSAPHEPGRHRWYAFPEMRADETVAFRTYDTDLVARSQTYFTPHSAFRDHEVPVGQPSRTSIELRATCLWL